MTETIECVPDNWWQVVLVGMLLPKDHPAIQRKPRMPKGEKYEGSVGAWRTARIGAKGMPAAMFDNAIRAGQRDREESKPRMRPGQPLSAWESACREELRQTERRMISWLASYNEVPIILRPAMHDWASERPLVNVCRVLNVEPECWEYDDERLDKVRTPASRLQAA